MESHSYELDALDLDVIELALRNDIDLKRYVPEVKRLCTRLALPSRPWPRRRSKRAVKRKVRDRR
jgi:hypothetical protein